MSGLLADPVLRINAENAFSGPNSDGRGHGSNRVAWALACMPGRSVFAPGGSKAILSRTGC